jgi:hypothetical protein
MFFKSDVVNEIKRPAAGTGHPEVVGKTRGASIGADGLRVGPAVAGRETAAEEFRGLLQTAGLAGLVLKQDVTTADPPLWTRPEILTASGLIQPAAQLGRIPRPVKYGNDADEFRLDAEKDAVILKNFDPGHANRPADQLESFGVLQDAFDGGVYFTFKAVSQTRLLFVIPNDGIFKFEPGLRVEDYLAGHVRPLIRSFSSVRTCSQGIPV